MRTDIIEKEKAKFEITLQFQTRPNAPKHQTIKTQIPKTIKKKMKKRRRKKSCKFGIITIDHASALAYNRVLANARDQNLVKDPPCWMNQKCCLPSSTPSWMNWKSSDTHKTELGEMGMYAQISSTETNTRHTHYKKIPANEMSEGNLFRFRKRKSMHVIGKILILGEQTRESWKKKRFLRFWDIPDERRRNEEL